MEKKQFSRILLLYHRLVGVDNDGRGDSVQDYSIFYRERSRWRGGHGLSYLDVSLQSGRIWERGQDELLLFALLWDIGHLHPVLQHGRFLQSEGSL